jgi:glycosyltransferase involved in cell wall biosynthesis
MIAGKRICVVMPAYNAARTLERTVNDIPAGIADDVILTDDGSTDGTSALARRLGLHVFDHDRNRGYGANQKTCYSAALARGADVVVMLHPDYQYDPRRLPDLARPIAEGRLDVVLGSRMRGSEALSLGMPYYKFAGNRMLTAWQNACLGASLTEYHTGYRSFSRGVLEGLPLDSYSDGFLFDCQILTDALLAGMAVGEVHCPARYHEDASSIGFWRSVGYGAGVIAVSAGAALRRAFKL